MAEVARKRGYHARAFVGGAMWMHRASDRDLERATNQDCTYFVVNGDYTINEGDVIGSVLQRLQTLGRDVRRVDFKGVMYERHAERIVRKK